MKKSLIAAALAATFITGCSEPQTTKTEEQQLKVATAAVTEKAELGSFGVDLTARNEAVKPGDDFFMYASGTWYDNYVMPADKTRYGAFSGLAERSEGDVKAIIEEIAARKDLNAEEKLVADFYNAYMDTETLNKLGVAPIKPLLSEINDIASTDDLAEMFGKS